MATRQERFANRKLLFDQREYSIKDKIMDVVDDAEVPDIIDIIRSGTKDRIKPLKWLRRFALWLIKNA